MTIFPVDHIFPAEHELRRPPEAQLNKRPKVSTGAAAASPAALLSAPTTPLPETRPAQPPSVSPTSALLQPAPPVDPPPDGPKFDAQEKVWARVTGQGKEYTGWIVTVLLGTPPAPATYNVRFSKQTEPSFEVQQVIPEANIRVHELPGLPPLLVPPARCSLLAARCSLLAARCLNLSHTSPTDLPFWVKDALRKAGNRQNMLQGEAVGSSSRARGAGGTGASTGPSSRGAGGAGGSSGPSSGGAGGAGERGPSSGQGRSRPPGRKPASPPGERRSNPARDLNCIYPTCKSACEGSVVGKPCGPRLSLALSLPVNITLPTLTPPRHIRLLST
jgi:hypothetical protein